MVTTPERTETTHLSLDEKLLVWLDRVDKHPRGNELTGTQSTENLLTQGYQLFFEILEPLREAEWIQAEHPDFHYNTWHNSRFDDRIKEFQDLFDRFGGNLGIQIYDYGKASWFSDSVEASIRLSSGDGGIHGEKLIKVLYSPGSFLTYPNPQGQMYVEDTTASWVRPRANGEVKTEKEKNLYDYPGISICKLAVVLADSFAKDQVKKLQA